MTAFVSFIQTFAVWIFLLCGLGILLAIKMLVDAQRLSRTTLFSLDQERASEQTYRALIVLVVFFIAIIFVAAINLILAPVVPSGTPAILRGPTPTLAPMVLGTATRAPTATFTPAPIANTPLVTSVPVTATIARTATRPPLPPPAPATATVAYVFPAPKPTGPVPNGGTWSGEGQANAAITFRWTCDQCALGANDWYEVVITYVDKSGVSRTIAGRSQEKFLSLRKILDGGAPEIYQKAKEDTFQWFVQIKRDPTNMPLSPPSEVWKFVWK
ncbi:MAG: hypothetical protein FJ009_08945 [Chloroflexi bacterium]|nr:hypothetical protein [Chloroflexota bacterium]